MKKHSKAKLIIPSLLTIFGSIAIGAGSTYSLFTSESTSNITISSGKVDVTSSLSLTNVYSPKSIDSEGNISDSDNAVTGFTSGGSSATFFNGGTVSLSGNTLLLNNMTPGDSVTLSLSITNNSSINAKYRYSILKDKDMGLFDGLSIVENNNDSTTTTLGSYISKWNTITNSDKDLVTKSITISLPTNATDEYMNTTTSIAIKVEAIQGNADTDVVTVTPTTAQSILDQDLSNKTVYFESGTYDTLYIRASASATKDTRYYNCDIDATNMPPAIENDPYSTNKVDNPSSLTMSNKRGYYRTLSNVTFVGASNAKIKGIKAVHGSETSGTDSVTNQTFNSETTNYHSIISYQNVSFINLNFTESMYLNHNNEDTENFLINGLNIDNCSFYSSSDMALYLQGKYGDDRGEVNITNSSFTATGSSKTGLYMGYVKGTYNISYCTFKGNTFNGIQLSSTSNSTSAGKIELNIKNNYFYNNADRPLRFSGIWDEGSSILIENNEIHMPTNSGEYNFVKSDAKFTSNEGSLFSATLGSNKYYDKDGHDLGTLNASNSTYFVGCVAKS